MRKTKKHNLKGMTLVEVLVAMLIFSFIATIASGIFVSMYKAYYNSKVVQRNMEDANYGMGLMAKILRTSTIVDPIGKQTDVTEIKVFDNSQSRCYIFTFAADQFRVKESSKVADKNSCPENTSLDYATNFLSTGKIKGLFRQSWQSNKTNATYRVGLITLRMSIGDDQEGDLVHIQTTMSLRDYAEVI